MVFCQVIYTTAPVSDCSPLLLYAVLVTSSVIINRFVPLCLRSVFLFLVLYVLHNFSSFSGSHLKEMFSCSHYLLHFVLSILLHTHILPPIDHISRPSNNHSPHIALNHTNLFLIFRTTLHQNTYFMYTYII